MNDIIGKEKRQVLLVGQKNSGVSTICGNLMYHNILSDRIQEKELQEMYERASQIEGWHDYVMILNEIKAQEILGYNGIVTPLTIMTKKYQLNVSEIENGECPMRNVMIEFGRSDFVVVVLSAAIGEYEEGFSVEIENILSMNRLENKPMICVINKMDITNPEYSQERFEDIKKKFTTHLEKLGNNLNKVIFIPTSGMREDNVVQPKAKTMTWYTGAVLTDTIDSIVLPDENKINKPLRLTVTSVQKIPGVGAMPSGLIEAGVLKTGMLLTVTSTNQKGEVMTISYDKGCLKEACPSPVPVGFRVQNLTERDFRAGCIAGNSENNPPAKVESFEAQVVVFERLESLSTGYQSLLECHWERRLCTIEKILAICDASTGNILEENPSSVKAGASALVKVRLSKPCCVEKFSDYPALGRFVLMKKSSQAVVGAGIVKSV